MAEARIDSPPSSGVVARSFLLPALTFLFVFGWKITPAADLILLVSVGTTFVAFVLNDAPLDKRVLGLTWPMAALAGLAFAHLALSPHADAQLAQRSVRTVINTLGAAAICVLYARRYGATWTSRLCVHLFWIIVAHAALVVAMYLLPPLRTAVYALTDTARYVNDSASFKLGFRIPGLTYGLSQTSVLHLFGVMLVPLAWRETRSILLRVLIGAGASLIMFSMLLIGRSGLFIGALILPLTIVLCQRPTRLRLRGRLRRTLLPLAVLGCVASVAVSLVVQQLPEHFLTYNMARAGEVLLAFTEPGESGTVRAVQAMYILPPDPPTLLVGQGGMGRDAFQYVSSDVGYVRILFAAGIVGSLLLLAPFGAGLAMAARAWNTDRVLAVMTAGMLAATLVLHFKEIAVLTRNQWSVQALLICCCLASYDRARSRA